MANVIIKTNKANRFGNAVIIEGHGVKFDHEGKAEIDGHKAKEILEKHDDCELVEGVLPETAPSSDAGSDSSKSLDELTRAELVAHVKEMYKAVGKQVEVPKDWKKADIIELINAGVKKDEDETPLTREALKTLARPELLAILEELEKAKGVEITEFVPEQTDSEIIERILEVTEDASNDQ